MTTDRLVKLERMEMKERGLPQFRTTVFLLPLFQAAQEN